MRFRSADRRVTAEEIKRFAAEFDPQPYHLDEEAAKATPLKGLAASGWHTAAIAMRLMTDARPFGPHPLLGIGVDELRWLAPVRPGDVIHLEGEVIELVASRTPAVIVSASGMATGGRVLHHLKRVLPDTRNTVLFVGYQAPGTRGRALVEGAQEVKIHGQFIPVSARVERIDSMSAHADCPEILRWLRGFTAPPAMTYIVHGEPPGMQALQAAIARELGADAASAFGAGFGGSVWALVPNEEAGAFAERWAAHYHRAHPEAVPVRTLVTRPGAPAHRVTD